MTPRVTVAVPLYRSRRFLPVILGNLRALAMPDAEILISDRHGDDDALEVLRQVFGSDDRVRFFEGSDRLNWVEHYNLLLGEGAGRYFMWMPHDDTFPSGYVETLVERLDACPDAVLAFGRLRAIDSEGRPFPDHFPAPARRSSQSWSIHHAVELLRRGPAVPFRGVFRREGAPALSGAADTIAADACWVFDRALAGRLLFEPSCESIKRVHPASAVNGFRPGISQVGRVALEMRRALDRHVSSRRDRLIGLAGIYAWAGWWGLTLPARRLPGPVKRRIKEQLYGA